MTVVIDGNAYFERVVVKTLVGTCRSLLLSQPQNVTLNLVYRQYKCKHLASHTVVFFDQSLVNHGSGWSLWYGWHLLDHGHPSRAMACSMVLHRRTLRTRSDVESSSRDHLKQMVANCLSCKSGLLSVRARCLQVRPSCACLSRQCA